MTIDVFYRIPSSGVPLGNGWVGNSNGGGGEGGGYGVGGVAATATNTTASRRGTLIDSH